MWSANPYTNQYLVLRGALKYFKWSAHRKSLGTTVINSAENYLCKSCPALAPKLLVRIISVINFTHILLAAFPPISLCQKNTHTNCDNRKAVCYTFIQKKTVRKMLVKLIAELQVKTLGSFEKLWRRKWTIERENFPLAVLLWWVALNWGKKQAMKP